MQPYHVDHHHHYLPDYWALPGLLYPPAVIDYHYHIDPYIGSSPYHHHHDPYIYEPALGWFRSSKSVTDELKSSKIGQSSSKRRESSPKRGQSSSKRKKSSFAKKKVSAKTSPLQREAGRKRKATSGNRNQKRSTTKRRKSSSKGRKITKSSERAKNLSKKRKRRGNTKSGQAEDVEESKKRFPRSPLSWEEIQAWRHSWGQQRTTSTTRAPIRAVNIGYGGHQASKKRKSKRPGRRGGVSLKRNQQESGLEGTVQSFLTSVVQAYGQDGGAVLLNTDNEKKNPGKVSVKKKLFRKLRKFSAKNIENMISLSRKELRLSLGGSKKPRSTSLPWAKLKRLLTKGIRGPDVSRSGMEHFVRSSYPGPSRKTLRSLKKRQRAGTISELTGDKNIPTYVLPLRGDETAFQYKGDTCEYIFENAVGKEGRKNARSLCRKWKRKNQRRLRSKRKI